MMKPTNMGQPIRRKEDERFLKGDTQYTDDLNLPGQYYAHFIRSPYAHAEIGAIDFSHAEKAEGVQGIYSGEAIQKAGLGSLPSLSPVPSADGTPMFVPPHPLLAFQRARFLGDPVVMLVAETAAQAVEAADLVQIDYKELPFNVELNKALDPKTPKVWEEQPNNQCVHFQIGNAHAVQKAFEQAHTLVELEVTNNRLIPNALEPRSYLTQYDPLQDSYTLYSPTQGVIFFRKGFAQPVFHKPEEDFRIISKDTGGGFGSRTQPYAEACLCLWAAKELGNPIKWTGTRSEMFLTDLHARDQILQGTMALDAQGKILGLKVKNVANMGAYLAPLAAYVPTQGGGRTMGTVYDIPAVHLNVHCVFTHTAPVEAYRGAGRPEAAYLTERLVETAARKMGISSDEIRRINFIAPESIPYTNFDNVVITSGNFAQTQALALQHAHWENFEERRHASQAQGKRRGRGIGYYIETSGAAFEEEARIRFDAAGKIQLIVGSHSHGQGHETVFSQILSDQLGVGFEEIQFMQGDTDFVKFGGVTGGSRTSQMGGMAVFNACQEVVQKGKTIAAHLLQAEEEAIIFAEGIFQKPATNPNETANTISLKEVAKAAADSTNLPEGMEAGLDITHRYHRGEGYTIPNGCHVCEVEVDPETGIVEIVRYTTVDDCGKVLNPLIVQGQLHGGLVQGMGQALFEEAIYDPNSGQLLTGSLLDYCLPKAKHVPALNVHFNEVPDPNNALGVKGVGESGTCGAPPAVVHAVLDALKEFGVEDLPMPLTAERVWRAIHG